jgi:hypothetical protein
MCFHFLFKCIFFHCVKSYWQAGVGEKWHAWEYKGKDFLPEFFPTTFKESLSKKFCCYCFVLFCFLLVAWGLNSGPQAGKAGAFTTYATLPASKKLFLDCVLGWNFIRTGFLSALSPVAFLCLAHVGAL